MIDEYRAWLRSYDKGKWARHAELSDADLMWFIQQAKIRIGGRRLSWHIVAAEMMDKGKRDPHE